MFRERTNNAETKSTTLRNLLEDTQALLRQQQYQGNTSMINGSPRKPMEETSSTSSTPLSLTDQEVRSPLTKLSVNNTVTQTQLPPGGLPVSPGPVTRHMSHKFMKDSQAHVRPPGNTMENKVRMTRTEPFSSEIPFSNGIEFQFLEEKQPEKPATSSAVSGGSPSISPAKSSKYSRVPSMKNIIPGVDEPKSKNNTNGVSPSAIIPDYSHLHSSHIRQHLSSPSSVPDITVRPLMLMAGATALPKWYKRNTLNPVVNATE